MTTISKVNRELKSLGINGKMVRNPKGYYYFTDDLLGVVPSIYAYNLNSYTVEQIVNHVKNHKPNTTSFRFDHQPYIGFVLIVGVIN